MSSRLTKKRNNFHHLLALLSLFSRKSRFFKYHLNLLLNTILNWKLQKIRNIFDRHLQSFFLFSLRICRQCMQDLVYRIYRQCVCKSQFQHFLLFLWWCFQIVKSKDFFKINLFSIFYSFIISSLFQWLLFPVNNFFSVSSQKVWILLFDLSSWGQQYHYS